jgi:DNA-binding CsgD family transcriptional regulator
MLLGRAVERNAIDRVLESGRQGCGAALMLRGEPGVGKTALLSYAREGATGYRVLMATGVETEVDLPFAALHQLLGKELGRVDRLPAPQASAVRAAFGLARAEHRDSFLISLGVLGLLADAAEEQPALCVVDDTQWLDEPSAAVLLFVARRIENERMVLLGAMRAGEQEVFSADFVRILDVAGLDTEATDQLLASRPGPSLAPEVRDRLLDEAGGNPLALIELPGRLSEAQRSGHEPLIGPLTPAARLLVAYRSQVAALDEQTRMTLLIAAAEGSGDLRTIRRAADAAGLDGGPLHEAERAGLVRVTGNHVAFRHPLLRSAVYHGATLPERQATHRMLAGALEPPVDLDRQAWHLALAAQAPDETAASALERSADRALERGGHGAAATALQKAAALSEHSEVRGRRMLAAAEAAWLAGAEDRALALLADPTVRTSPELQLSATGLRGRIDIRRGAFEEVLSVLLPAAEEVAGRDPVAALELLVHAEGAALFIGEKASAVRIGRLAAKLIDQGIDRASTRALRGIGLACDHDVAAAVPHLQRALRDVNQQDIDELMLAMQAAVMLGEDVRAVELPLQAARLARERGALGELPRVLQAAAFGELRLGRLSSVCIYAEEALRVADELGQESGLAICELALVAAIQGREDEARSLAAEGRRRGHERRSGLLLSLSAWAIGLLELSLGQPERAEAALRLALPGGGMPSHHLVALIVSPDYVEAASRAGNEDGARDRLEAFERFVRDIPLPWGAALAAHCRGLLTGGAGAESEFRRAIDLHPIRSRPFARARSELALGQLLRRERKRREARTHLRVALEAFQRVGADPWAELARVELRATGETVPSREPGSVLDLTPQELQIARMAATGARNRQIAAELFLSPRTIDYHLRKVFTKLGISSRAELAGLHALTAGSGDAE